MELFLLTRNDQTPSPTGYRSQAPEGGCWSYLPLCSAYSKTTIQTVPSKSTRGPSKKSQENSDGSVRLRRFYTLKAMNTWLVMEHWGALVNDFKDSEKEHDQDGYTSEQLAKAILDYSRFTRFRQWTLYTQQRGKEFEDLLVRLEKDGHSLEAAKRFLADEDLWKTTIELAAM